METIFLGLQMPSCPSLFVLVWTCGVKSSSTILQVYIAHYSNAYEVCPTQHHIKMGNKCLGSFYWL